MMPLVLPPVQMSDPPQAIDVTVTADLQSATGPMQVQIVQPKPVLINAAHHSKPMAVSDWDSYIGQEPLKEEVRAYIDSALRRYKPLAHTLLASGMPGVGKTTLARLIAHELGGELTMLVPPFAPETLYEAVMAMQDFDILFIDEIHKLTDHSKAAAENLLHLMEEGALYLDDGVHYLANITVIGATTDPDRLPEPILDRFRLKPSFEKYSLLELVQIVKTNFCKTIDVELLPETMVAIAKACRATPRVARELVEGAQVLQDRTGFYCTPEELLKFKRLEADGVTRQHRAYLLALYQYFGREREDKWEYIAGEASLMNILRETKQGVARLERFLIELGLVDRTPSGRRLTDRGIARARGYVANGEKLNSE